MQENNFEKEVRQKLDELSLTPSAPVWQRVEDSIKKKRERRLIFWLMPVLLVGIGLVWWQMPTWQAEVINQEAVAAAPQQRSTFSKSHIATPNQATENAVNEPRPLTMKKTQPESNVSIKKPSSSTTNTTAKKQSHVVSKSHTISPSNALKELNQGSRAQHKKRVIVNEARVVVEGTPAHLNPLEQVTTTQEDSLSLEPIANMDSLLFNNDSVKISEPPSIQPALKKRLQWSVVSRIGASNMVEAFATGVGLKSSGRFDSPIGYSAGNPPNSSGAPWADSTMRRQPAAPAKGLHISVGARVKKQLGKQSFLVAGLQYSFNSNHLVVGSKLSADSFSRYNLMDAQAAFRNNGTYNRFTNRFHILELPIGFEYSVFKQRWLHLQHGITISQLLSSRALQYDDVFNNYYQNAANVRQTGFHIFTVADITVWKAGVRSLQAGPYLQYGVHNIYKPVRGNHLLSGGMQVAMSF